MKKKIAVVFSMAVFLTAAAFASINVPFYPVGSLVLTGTTPPGYTENLSRTLYFTFAGGSSDPGNSSYSSEGTSTLGTDKIIIGWEAYSQTPVTSQVGVTFVDVTQLAADGETPDSDYGSWPGALKDITCNIEAGNNHCFAPGFDSFDQSFAATISGSDALQVRITSNAVNMPSAPTIRWKAVTE